MAKGFYVPDSDGQLAVKLRDDFNGSVSIILYMDGDLESPIAIGKLGNDGLSLYEIPDQLEGLVATDKDGRIKIIKK